MSWVLELKDKHKDKWEETFSHIDNEALRIKAACLIWWDCQREKDDPIMWFTHKKLIRQYNRKMELEYSDNKLEEVLIEIGYPKEVAKHRCHKSNDTRGV